jgi:ATP-dependent protease ClpP protease subunit
MLTDTTLLYQPNIRIAGNISSATLWDVLNALDRLRQSNDDLVVEVMTEGGDADIARRIALEISLFLRDSGRNTYFVGKTIVYSAGMTIMGAFPAANRFATKDTTFLIHERRISKSLSFDGPMRAMIQIAKEQVAMLETARRLEWEGFEDLARGSQIDAKTLYDRAKENYYLSTNEAIELGLLARII